MPRMIWLGIDVHAASVTIACYEDDAPSGTVTTLVNEPRAIARYVQGLPAATPVRACYEAGPCGYVLHRQLSALGIPCDVIAPALIPRRPGQRVKTDRRDAHKLARLYRAGELTPIAVPTPAQEAVRDLVRAREDVRHDRTAARQRLGKFLLRQGLRYPGTNWTKRHREWIARHHFTGPTQLVFEHYCAQVSTLDDRLHQLEGELLTLAAAPPLAPVVTRLACLRGLGPLGATMIAAELYDLRRFARPRQLMAYLGLTPSEHSSGGHERRGRITKTCNAIVRRVLIEAGWTYRHPARHSQRARAALRTQPPSIRTICERALPRLSARYRRLVGRGKAPTKAVTAVARELAGFVWAVATIPAETV
jgi:transposase